MTHVDDLGEPLGYDDDPEPDYQPAPVDLDALDEAACIALNSGDEAAREKASAFVLGETHRLVAQCRAQRQQLAEWEALPVREEWAVTPGRQQVPQEFDFHFPDGLTAEEAAKRQGRQLWRRQSSVRSWDPIDYAPF